MIRTHRILAGLVLWLGTSSLPTAALADDDATGPFYDGIYVSPMATGILPPGDKGSLKKGYGATLPVGYRSGWYAIEIAPIHADLKHATVLGASVNGLLFPFRSLPNLYGTIGLGALDYRKYETPAQDEEFNAV